MKNLILVTVVLIIFLQVMQNESLAQGISGKGIKFGVNYSNYYGNSGYEDFKYKIGFIGGGFIIICINDNFSIQPELLLSMKGAKQELFITGETEEQLEKGWFFENLTYLEFPLLAKLKIPINDNVNPNVFVGPSLALKLSSKWKLDATGGGEGNINELKPIDFGLIFGGGTDLYIGKRCINIDIRYTLGQTKLGFKGGEDTKVDVKNKVITLMIGFSF